tara:strand:- start:72 stop:716 length:645 start_codon:yes stop_codon:yes gene_type:complete
MPRKKTLNSLARDIEKSVEQARTEASKEIIHTLQQKGPWWTGSFAKSWVVSSAPVVGDELKRDPNPPYWDAEAIKEARRPRTSRRPKFPVVNINQTLYVGNASSYALFATGYWGEKIHHFQTMMDIKGKKVTYAQHGKRVQALTPKIEPKPSWYRIYLNDTQYLMRDINRAFRSKNFVIRKTDRKTTFKSKNYTGNVGSSGQAYNYQPRAYLDL